MALRNVVVPRLVALCTRPAEREKHLALLEGYVPDLPVRADAVNLCGTEPDGNVVVRVVMLQCGLSRSNLDVERAYVLVVDLQMVRRLGRELNRGGSGLSCLLRGGGHGTADGEHESRNLYLHGRERNRRHGFPQVLAE